MSETYSPPTDNREGMQVQVTSVEEPNAENTGEHPMDIMERFSQTSKTSWTDDPVAWQREIRKDRPLPGREE